MKGVAREVDGAELGVGDFDAFGVPIQLGAHLERYINTQATAFLKGGEPVVSVDTKKKELVGNYRNNGREWRAICCAG
jgi:hypothetical protein